MSIREMSRVWNDSEEKGNNLLLLLAIADNANDDGYCFPGVSYLAKKTRQSKRTVVRMLSALEESGEIAIIRKRSRGNHYMVLSGCNELVRQTRLDTLAEMTDTERAT